MRETKLRERKQEFDEVVKQNELAEWGKEIAKSLAVLFNKIEEGEIPKQQQLKTIKSVRKKENQGKLSESQRRLFIVNLISRDYERVKKTQNEKVHKNMKQMQVEQKGQLWII